MGLFRIIRDWMNEMFRGRLFQFKKVRLLFAWLGGALLFLNSNVDDQGFRMGVPFILAGEFVRIWASGYFEKKGRKLATCGPFAHVRNPLYIGNFFLGFGFVLISKNLLNLVLFLIGFIILYRGVIQREERELTETFGEDYIHYAGEVPSLIPRWTPYASREPTHFQWSLLIRHREHQALLGIVVLIVSFYLWEGVVVSKGFHLKQEIALAIGAIAVAGLLADRSFELFKKTRKRLAE